jgi:hypothetical protein
MMATKSPKRLVLSGVSSIDDDQFPVLHGQERLNRGNSKARCPVIMLHHDPMNSPIRQQCQKLGALIVDATAAFFDDFADRPADAAFHHVMSLSACVSRFFLFSV